MKTQVPRRRPAPPGLVIACRFLGFHLCVNNFPWSESARRPNPERIRTVGSSGRIHMRSCLLRTLIAQCSSGRSEATESRGVRWAGPSTCMRCLALLLILLALGCGSKQKFDTAEVSGTVLFKGKALPGGEVTFAKVDGIAVNAVIDEDGHYTISAPICDV